MTHASRHPGHRARGFTLLEMLAALAMVAVLLVSLYASLHIAFDARQRAERRMEPVTAAHAAVQIMRLDLESSLPPTGLLAGAFTMTNDTLDDGRDGDTLSIHTASGIVDVAYAFDRSYGEEDAFTPTAAAESSTPTVIGGDVIGVEYELVATTDESPDAAGTYDLVRRVTRNLLAPVTPTPTEQVVCRRVVSMNLRAYSDTEWLDTWDSGSQDNTLPTALEMVLRIQPSSGSPIGASPKSTTTSSTPRTYTIVQVFELPCHVAADSGGASR